MMISILIVITQQNSPQSRYFIFTSNKSLATIKLRRIKEKEIILIVTINLPPLLTHSSLLTLFYFVSLLPNDKQRKYVYKGALPVHAQTYIYVRACNSTYDTNILTFNNTYNLNPFKQKINHINWSFFENLHSVWWMRKAWNPGT